MLNKLPQYQHITDNGHIRLSSNDVLEGNPILTGSPIGRFIFTEWDSFSVELTGHNITVRNCMFDGRRREIEGRYSEAAICVRFDDSMLDIPVARNSRARDRLARPKKRKPKEEQTNAR